MTMTIDPNAPLFNFDKNLVLTNQDFMSWYGFFTDESDEARDFRKQWYEQWKEKKHMKSEAHAKQDLLYIIFSNFIQTSLEEAKRWFDQNPDNQEVLQSIDQKLIEPLSLMRNILKSYDIDQFGDFFSNIVDLNEQEVRLLFSDEKLILTQNDLNVFVRALYKSLSRQAPEITDKSSYLIAFVNHPLIDCLVTENWDKNESLNQIHDRMYAPLIKALIELRSKENDEKYQHMITFLINEDLSKGFNNIMNMDHYDPDELKRLLICVQKGESISSDRLKALKEKLSEKRENIRVENENGEKKIQSVNHSNGTLNDYGTKVVFPNGFELQFLGHETSTNGKGQDDQMINTVLRARSINGVDTFSLTVLGKLFLRDDEALCWINEDQLSHKLQNITKMEEMVLSNMQFYSAFLTHLSNLNQENLMASDLFASQQMIWKGDIERSKKIMGHMASKNDFQAIFDIHGSIMKIVRENKDFFRALFLASDTNKEMKTHLSVSVLNWFTNALNAQINQNIHFFNEEDMDLLMSLKVTGFNYPTGIQNEFNVIRNNTNLLKLKNIEAKDKPNPSQEWMDLVLNDQMRTASSDDVKIKVKKQEKKEKSSLSDDEIKDLLSGSNIFALTAKMLEKIQEKQTLKKRSLKFVDNLRKIVVGEVRKKECYSGPQSFTVNKNDCMKRLVCKRAAEFISNSVYFVDERRSSLDPEKLDNHRQFIINWAKEDPEIMNVLKCYEEDIQSDNHKSNSKKSKRY